MNNEKLLEDLFEKNEKNEERIDNIMDKIQMEEMPITYMHTKKRKNRVKQFIAAAVICALMFMPYKGESFAGSLINWVKETVIETEYGSFEAKSGEVTGEAPDYITKEYSTIEDMFSDMGDYTYLVADIPSNFTFNSATIHKFGQEPYVSFQSIIEYVDNNSLEENKPTMFLTNIVIKNEKVDSDVNRNSIGVMSEGLLSTSIEFLDEEALFTNANDLYQIHAPYIVKNSSEFDVSIMCSLSYKNFNVDGLWQDGLKILEDIYLQFK